MMYPFGLFNNLEKILDNELKGLYLKGQEIIKLGFK